MVRLAQGVASVDWRKVFHDFTWIFHDFTWTSTTFRVSHARVSSKKLLNWQSLSRRCESHSTLTGVSQLPRAADAVAIASADPSTTT